MGEQEFNPAEMDKAAELAKGELELLIAEKQFTPETFLSFYARNYLKAGHKRLGRLFVQMAKAQNPNP